MKRRTTKNKQRNNNGGGSLTKYEKMSIARIRTNTTEFACIIRGAVTDANTGGIGAQSYSFFLNYPSYYRNASATIAQLPTISPLINDEKSVFDEYKVTKLTVKYMPWINSQVRVSTAVAFTAPTDPTLVMSYDYDDSANYASNAQAMGSQNAAIFSSVANVVGQRLPQIVMRQKDKLVETQWLNFQAIIPSAAGSPDPNNPVKISALKVRKFGYQLMNTTEGTFYAEWTILLKGVYTLN